MFQGPDDRKTAYGPLEEIGRRLRAGALAALTTDVFDTVLWRTVPEPADAFVALGQELRDRGALDPGLEPRSFAALRRGCEASARESRRARHGDPEVTLEEIWERIPGWSHGSLSRREAEAVELEVERRLLVPDLEVLELLSSANEAGVPVCAVSDTYFSQAQLRALLEQPGLDAVRFDEVFTSSDRRSGKSEDLFDQVLGELGLEPSAVAHLGDNEAADVRPPRERGMAVAHLPRRPRPLGELLRRESAFRRVRALAPERGAEEGRRDLAQLEGSLVQLRAKMALRAEASEAPTSLAPFWKHGAEVLGPPLTGFAEWVVERAESQGATRVHCLMREGEFLGRLIGEAARAAGGGISAHPMFLNRQIASVASIGDGSRAELERLLERREPPTGRQLLGMLDIDPALAPALAGQLDSRLDEGVRRSDTLDVLCGDQSLRHIVRSRARTLRERVVRMVLAQHDGEGPLILVDLGWGASIQRGLAELLRQAGIDTRVDGLYLLTHAGAAESAAAAGRVAGFLADFGHPETICEAVMRSPEALEQACMPAIGTQRWLTGELQPVLADLDLPSSQLAEAAAVRNGALAFQREYLRYRAALPEKVPRLSGKADQLAPILARSCIDPTAEEAARLGAWRHDPGQGAEKTEPLADARLEERLRHMAPAQVRRLPMAEHYWPSAVARLHDPDLADLAAAQSAGLLEPTAGTAPVETGAVAIEMAEGIALDRGTEVELEPRRNHHGLSYLRAQLRGGHIERLRIRLGTRPALVRLDRLALRLHLKDSAEPREVRLDGPEGAAALELLNVTRFSERVLATTADHGFLVFPTSAVAFSHIVYRVDVELCFAVLAWDAQTSGRAGLGSESAERELRRILASRSWRMTRPLRGLSRLLRS